MQNIALPKKIEFVNGAKPNQKLATIEPLFPGYGTTLGNAIRRVLLASLPGAAVIGAKIKGADHEFMGMPGVKEDVLEILLNLKQLRLKINSDEPVIKLDLTVTGKKVITAKDIVKNSAVEIVNPELVIATTTDDKAELTMEIFVRKGLGYETIEAREEKKHEIGYIEIDSAYSPVVLVGISVDNARVGKMTNWDKLVLSITTDGTITPEEAFDAATKILINQFNSVLELASNKTTEEMVVEAEAEVVVEEPAKEETTKKGKK